MTTNGYTVEEYNELDFENVVLESALVQSCSSCSTELDMQYTGIQTCAVCGTFNHIDMVI